MKTAHEILSNSITRLSEIMGQIALLTAEADTIKEDLHKCAGLVGEQPFTFFEARPKAPVGRGELVLRTLSVLEDFGPVMINDLVSQMILAMPEPVVGRRDQRKTNAHRDVQKLIDGGFLVESAEGFISLASKSNT